MSDIVFKDCEYRYVEDGTLCCKKRCNEYWEEAGLNSDYFE